MVTSGGSPASRARVMRSCMMLKASDHHRRDAGSLGIAEKLPLERALRSEHRAQPRLPGHLLAEQFVALVRSVACDGGAAAEHVGVEVDRDDEPRAKRAGRRHRHRVDECAIDEPTAAEADRREDARKCIGSAQRFDQAAARQPDFVPGPDLRADGGKADRQLFDQRVAERLFESACKLPPLIRPAPDRLMSR